MTIKNGIVIRVVGLLVISIMAMGRAVVKSANNRKVWKTRSGERRRLLGDFEWNVSFRFGGTPYHVAERGLKLFAEELLTVLKSW